MDYGNFYTGEGERRFFIIISYNNIDHLNHNWACNDINPQIGSVCHGQWIQSAS